LSASAALSAVKNPSLDVLDPDEQEIELAISVEISEGDAPGL